MGKEENVALSSLRGNKTGFCVVRGSLGRGRDLSEEARIKLEWAQEVTGTSHSPGISLTQKEQSRPRPGT